MLDKQQVKYLFMYRYPIAGIDIQGKLMQNAFTPYQTNVLIKATNKYTSFNPYAIMYHFYHYIKQLPNKLTIPVSGGIDSTFLLLVALKLNKEVELLNVKFKNYDESPAVKALGNEVGIKPVILNISPNKLVKEFPTICNRMQTPNERGSTLLSYFIYKHASYDILSAEMMDCLMSPSMAETQEAESTHNLHTLFEKLSRPDYYHLARNTFKPAINFPFSKSKLTTIMLFDMLHEAPFYYHTRYKSFANQNIYTPCQTFNISKLCLEMDTLHDKPNKPILRQLGTKLAEELNLNPNICHQPKGIFKVDPSNYAKLLAPFINHHLLSKHVNLHACEYFKDYERNWTIILAAIISEWVNQHAKM